MNKKNNNQKFETVDIPEGTILESFKEYIKEHNREDDIIKFLSVKSAWLMTRIAMSDMRGEDDLPEKEKEEIKDFYEFFINNFYSKYEKAIYRNCYHRAWTGIYQFTVKINDGKSNDFQ